MRLNRATNALKQGAAGKRCENRKTFRLSPGFTPGFYQIPTSFHQTGPIPSQIARFTSEITKPSRHHSPCRT